MCVCVWVYRGTLEYHFNMHHRGAIYTMVHKGDYIFWQIQRATDATDSQFISVNFPSYIMHHYNGIWGPCSPSGRNMHHQAAMCTMVHKGDHIPL